jgi:hypothetical protein
MSLGAVMTRFAKVWFVGLWDRLARVEEAGGMSLFGNFISGQRNC